MSRYVRRVGQHYVHVRRSAPDRWEWEIRVELGDNVWFVRLSGAQLTQAAALAEGHAWMSGMAVLEV